MGQFSRIGISIFIFGLAIALSMFGVTTPCVESVRKVLETKYDCLIFHATGTGGQSLEKLAESGLIIGAIDVTTTEVCDEIAGGVFSAGSGGLGDSGSFESHSLSLRLISGIHC